MKKKTYALVRDLHDALAASRCPEPACNNAGVITNGAGDIEQCQRCWERNELTERAREVLLNE